MVEVAQEIITEYLTDSTNKEIIVENDGYDTETLNYYTGDISDYVTASNTISMPAGDFWVQSIPVNANPTELNLHNYFHVTPLITDWNYLNVSFYFKINSTSDSSIILNNVQFDLAFSNHNYPVTIPKADALSGTMVCISVPRTAYLENLLATETTIELNTWMINSAPSSTWTVNYSVSQMSINYTKQATSAPTKWEKAPNFDKGVNLEKYTIDNDNLIYEEFVLTESLCSQDNIKFGLCEAAHCEFSEIGINEPKIGDRITIVSSLPNMVEDISDADIFNINWVGDAGQGTQTAVSDLGSWIAYLPYNSSYRPIWGNYINRLGLGDKYIYYQFKLKFEFNNLTGNKPTYFKFRYRGTINGTEYYFTGNNFLSVSNYDNQFGILYGRDPIRRGAGDMTDMRDFDVRFYDENQAEYAIGQVTGSIRIYAEEIQFRIGEIGYTMPVYTQTDLYVANGELEEYLSQFETPKIPLGVFYISSVSDKYRHNLIEKHITAYDNLLTLEQNAADWYTRYMFGVDMDGYTSNGFEYARQIYSTYWNYVTSIGLDSRDNYSETRIAYYEYFADIKPNHISGKVLSWASSQPIKKIRYAYFNVPNPDPSKMYMVSFVNSGGDTDEATIRLLPTDYFTQVDALGRGVATNGSILIEATVTGGAVGYCVNKNDYFMLPEDCTSFIVYTPVYTEYDNGTSHVRLLDDLSIYEVTTKPRLVNGDIRLCYYNYGTKDIFACESNITGRDVVRSLLEVCGCFFRLDRLYGLPEFVYPTKGGLYPSNTLFPADDLYPRSGTDSVFPMGKYISIIAENYEVKNYGRIQILKNIKSSKTQSVVEWQYEGDSDEPSTYIIDDNIFYCAEEMEYDYDGMPEVAKMLKNMWNVVSNLGYVPNVTEALGAPWLECGDRVGLLTYNGGFESFIFRRTLKGIQNLRDTYESEGDELIEAISNFGY